MWFGCILITLGVCCTTSHAILIPSPKDVKLFTHGDTVYKLHVVKGENGNIVEISPVSKIPNCVNLSTIKPVREFIDEESQLRPYTYEKRKTLIATPDPITQIKLSRFGKYVGYPRFYGLSGAYGYYHYNAGNDVSNNLPRGQYKFEADIDSK